MNAAGRLDPARVLSVVVVGLMAAASLGGLFIDGLYRESTALVERYRASDLVTLVIVVPALILSLRFAARGSVRAVLGWAAMLAYAVYSYAFYVFGTAFNDFFLVHVTVFSASLFALVLVLARIEAADVARTFGSATPVRFVAAFLVLIGASLAAMWIFYSLRFAISGDAPEESLLVGSSASIHLGYALDLTLLVPSYVLAGVLLWRRAPWGFVLAPVLVASGVLHQLNYIVGLLFQTAADVPDATAFDPLEMPIVAMFAIATALLLTNVRQKVAR